MFIGNLILSFKIFDIIYIKQKLQIKYRLVWCDVIQAKQQT